MQIPKKLTSDVVYKFQSDLCNETSYDGIAKHLIVISGEHIFLINFKQPETQTKGEFYKRSCAVL